MSAQIKRVNGRNLLCNKVLNTKLLDVGQQWAAANGADVVVVIVNINDKQISYKQINKPSISFVQTKDSFSFQTQYCLIV